MKGRVDVISYPYFIKVWRNFRPRLKSKNGTDFLKCHDCTQHKAVPYGTPGVRAVVDLAVREEAQMKYDAHLEVGTAK